MRTAYETFKASSTFGAKTAAAIAKADELAKVKAREEFEITVNVCNNPTDSKAWAFAISVMSKLQKELTDNGYVIRRIKGNYNRELNISWK